MPFYSLLFVTTSSLFLLAYLIWRKTRALVFRFGAVCLYFWSLHGAWAVVFDKRGGDSGLNYHYIEGKLFTIFLDFEYFLSIGYYAVFCIVVLLVALVFSSPKRSLIKRPAERRPVLNHPLLILISAGLGFASYYFIADVLIGAIVMGQTGYAAVTADTVPFLTLHKVLNRGAVVIGLIGFSIMMCGDCSRFFKANYKHRYFVVYVVLLTGLIGYTVLLGNKNTLVGGFSAALFIYFAHHASPPYGRIIGVSFMLVMIIGSVDYLRGFAILSGEGVDLDELLVAAASIFLSNEAFAAHFSMYGVLFHDVHTAVGKDLISLLSSIVPIDIWPDRPVGVYEDYAAGVAALAGQGYTIHHATAWYLDFGLAGLFMGASALGAIWILLFNRFAEGRLGSGRLSYIFWLIAPFTFTSYLPNILREGMSAYKGLVIDAFIIPVAILSLATVRWRILSPRKLSISPVDK